MIQERKVTSRELSEKLREKGARQESELVHIKHDSDKMREEVPYLNRLPKPETRYMYHLRPSSERIYQGEVDRISAFDCEELLERLPWKIEIGETLYCLELHKVGNRFWANYNHVDQDEGDTTQLAPTGGKDTPDETLGLLYLWCLGNGYIK